VRNKRLVGARLVQPMWVLQRGDHVGQAARPVLVHGQHAELVVLGVAFVGFVVVDQVDDIAPSLGSELRGALIGGALAALTPARAPGAPAAGGAKSAAASCTS